MTEHIRSESHEPLRLLFLEDASNHAEALVSHFRNAGLSTRVHRITSPEDLHESLNAHTWDLLLAFENSSTTPPDEALTEVIRKGKDLPCILLQNDEHDSERVVTWLQAGGTDAIPFSHTERLKLVCMREWTNLHHRRQIRHHEIALKEAEKRCHLLLDSSVDAIAYVHEGMHIHANPAYIGLFGYTDPDDLAGMPLIDMIHRDHQGSLKHLIRQFQQGETTPPPMDFKGEKNDGHHFQGVMTLSAAKWDGETCTQVVIRKAAADPELEQKLSAMKSTDILTGLFNRPYFTNRLDSAIAQAASEDKNYALIDIRLDKFRDLKNELGVARADMYLAQVAEHLKPVIQEHGIFARYSDDVFLALINHDIQPRLQGLGENILEDVKNLTVTVENADIQTTASIGIMQLTESVDNSHYVLNRAEKACLQSREEGGNKLTFHDHQTELQALAKEGDIVALVTQALEQGRFKLSYQPILNLENEQEQQYEVYSRLEDDQGNIVPAADFIAASKRAGLTTRIDRWAILHAINTLAEHRSQGHETRLFLTLGPDSIQDQTLPSWVNIALRAARLPGNALVFQMAEEDVAIHLDAAIGVCTSLQELHCEVCISHFGCAVEPFALLPEIPANYIKIDGSLVANVDDGDEEDLLRLKKTISTLRQQRNPVIVPRIESNKLLSALWQWDVNYVQGYYLQTPMDAMEYDFQ